MLESHVTIDQWADMFRTIGLDDAHESLDDDGG